MKELKTEKSTSVNNRTISKLLYTLLVGILIVLTLHLKEHEHDYNHYLTSFILITAISINIIIIKNYNKYIVTLFENINNEDIAQIPTNKDTISVLHTYQQNILQLKEVSTELQTIINNQESTSFEYLNTKESPGKDLISLREHIKNWRAIESQNNWTAQGLAKFEDLLRKNQNESKDDFSYIFLKELLSYVNAIQGSIFFLNQDTNLLELTTSYAFDRRKYLKKEIQIGEGLAGRCFIEKEAIYIDEIPKDYFNIKSGLGDIPPTSLYILPLKFNNNQIGILEIASLHIITEHQRQFIDKISDSFSGTITFLDNHLNNKKLLDETLKVTEELKEKEEVLKENSKELQVAKDKLDQQFLELEKESILTKAILDALSKTNAVIELDMNGRITSANEIYLSLMEFDSNEVLGKPERLFVSQEEIQSQRYELLWDSIKMGAFNAGEFKRKSKSGRDLWLTGSYSPIPGLDGKPYKVIQFAQFTTEQKAKELELGNKINAINNSIPLLEIKPNLSLGTPNNSFLAITGIKRMDIRNKKVNYILPESYLETDLWNDCLQKIKDGTPYLLLNCPIALFKDEQKTSDIYIYPSKNIDNEIDKYYFIFKDLKK